MGATTDGHGTDTDQQSTGQRCGGSETGISVSEMSASHSNEWQNQSLARRAVVFNRRLSMEEQWEAYWLAKAAEHFNNGKTELAMYVLLVNHKLAKTQ